MKNWFWVTVLLSTWTWAQKPIFTSAKTKAATVYFSSVELAQTAQVNLPAGSSEIVVKGVADYINEETIRVGAPSTLTVLSVQFSSDYISEYDIDEKNPKIKSVKDSITFLSKELSKVNNQKNSEAKTIELLDKNQQVFGVNTGLNVLELSKMVDFYKAKRTESTNNLVNLDEKITKLNERIAALKSKLTIDAQKEEKTSKGKLILQVMNSGVGPVPLDISYICPSASWQPFYDLRAASVTAPINMMYKAQLVQSTGVDWKGVKLTLSSGNPNQSNQEPQLESWYLKYHENLPMAVYLKKSDAIPDDNNLGVGHESFSSETVEDKKVAIEAPIVENQLNISFDIDQPYDILSNGKVHSVALSEIKLPATYQYYAAPRVEKDAFLLAEINDYSKYNLLPGEGNIIFDGMYVGKTFIDANQTADTLRLSMGRDKKIAIKREKVVDKSGTKFLSAYKEQTFTFDITVRNNKKEEVAIVLKDQYPLSSDKEIEIELLQSDKAKINTETGILTWELQLQANETKKLRLSYKVKYPKNKVIGNL